jgi:hypothetical protein
MSGWLFLVIVSAISVGVFLNGIRFSRMTESPFGQSMFGTGLSIEQLQRGGKLQMLLAPVIWLLFVLLIFGVFGPVEGISTIQL